jgi:hypothetical protein
VSRVNKFGAFCRNSMDSSGRNSKISELLFINSKKINKIKNSEKCKKLDEILRLLVKIFFSNRHRLVG